MNNWAYKVKSLLDSYGFSDAWINPHTVDLKNFFVVFKERVLDVLNKTGITVLIPVVLLVHASMLKLNLCLKNILIYYPLG